MKIDLTGKVAVVTGSSGGIGRAIALMLAAAGAKVAVNCFKNRESGEAVTKEIRQQGGEAQLFPADVTDVQQIEMMFAAVEEAFGEAADIVVNNAGHMIERRLTADMTEDLYHRVMDLNVKSTVFACKAALPGMKKKGGGTIVNMSSLAAHNGGNNGSSVYAATKAAVIAYSKGLAKEVAPAGIRVNVVAPGFIGDTKFHSTLTSEEARRAAISGVPLAREGTPADVAGSVLFLVSDLADYLTGETIEINGGALMR